MSCATDYDQIFASRFTAEDVEFQRYRQRAPDPPPVLENWRVSRGRRDRDRRAPEQRQQQQHHHHHHHHHHQQQERRWSDRRDERNSGSYGQRPHY